jgi:hypothetical protein
LDYHVTLDHYRYMNVADSYGFDCWYRAYQAHGLYAYLYHAIKTCRVRAAARNLAIAVWRVIPAKVSHEERASQ